MQLNILETTPDAVRAGYSCPCGCEPAVEYVRGAEAAREGCCCGNEFAVGRDAAPSLAVKPGFHREQVVFDAPWGESLEAAWSVGPSVHGPADEHEHHGDEGSGGQRAAVIDPVCGMTVEPDGARARGLHSSLNGMDYFFCGKGCKLEFDDDPERYLDPSYVPSM
jgi:YHS domain-containing protein